MKKHLSFILTFLIMAVILAGCGKQDQDAVSTEIEGGNLTKGQWIGMLGEGFGYDQPFDESAIYSDVNTDYEYFNQIQACAEWEVITETGTFGPDQEVTWDYVIQTAVRAIGLDNLESAGIVVDETALNEFFAQNVADITAVDLGSGISSAEAEQVIMYAKNYRYNLSPVERFEYTYNDGVYEVAADAIVLRGDGMTAVVTDGAAYQTGDIIYVQPTQNSTAYALKVTGSTGNEISYVLAEMENVYSEFVISGTYDGVIVSVDGADEENMDISFNNNYESMYCYWPQLSHQADSLVYTEQYQAMPVGFNVDGNNITFSRSLGSNGNFEVTISNIQVKTEIDYGIIRGLKKANATVTFNDKIELSYTSEHYAKTINLGKVVVNVGTTPCAVEISLVLNIGLDGEAQLTYTSKVIGNVSYKQGAGLSKSVDNTNATFDFHAQVTATAEPTIKVDLQLFGKSIVNLKVTSGVVAIATVDVDLMGNEPTCIDIYLYVPLRWAVNEDGCIMTAISDKLKYSQTVWNSDSSPINRRFHFEDFVETPNDECTRGQDNEVETPSVDEEGQPYDEYKIFEFEEINFEVIRTASTQIILDEGGSISIGFSSIPGGYQASDLVYTVSDASVCSVSGGVVQAIGNGSTTLKISTADGKYNTFVVIIVNGGYNDTSNFESL